MVLTGSSAEAVLTSCLATQATILWKGAGDDSLDGAAGRDLISGQDGNDFISAGSMNDTVSGGDGDDLIYADGGNDLANGIMETIKSLVDMVQTH